MGGNGDYEAGDESIGQVCEGPSELCYTFILSRGELLQGFKLGTGGETGSDLHFRKFQRW